MCMTTLGNRQGSCFSATADTASTHAGLLQLLFGGPLRVAPGALLVVHAPSPHRTTAHAMPTQRSRSSTPHAHRCPTPGIRSEFFSPPFRVASNPQKGCPRPSAAPPQETQITLVLVNRVRCPWIHRHPASRIIRGQPKNHWKEAANPSPHFVLVKQGCAPWPSFTAIGPSMIHLLSFQECSHDHR